MQKIILSLILLFSFAFSLDLNKLIKEGKAGNVDALNQLGFMYENGNGVKQDIKKAIRYYRQAAELGSEDAKLALALLNLYELINNPKSVSIDNSVVVKGSGTLNYKLSVSDLKGVLNRAKNGDKDAIFTLATIYDNGYGDIKADKEKAIALYKKAAKLGSKQAKNILQLLQK